MPDVRSTLLQTLARWARRKSRVAYAVVGALPGPDLAAWRAPLALPIGMPTDAPSPRQADVLVVVGRISHKLAPFLVRTHAAMAQPASVLVFDLEPHSTLPRTYATAHAVENMLPVDVLVRSEHPTPAIIRRALDALDAPVSVQP